MRGSPGIPGRLARSLARELRTTLGPALRGWRRFWFAGVDGTTHALVRVGFAVTGLLLCAVTAPILGEYYTSAADFGIADARGWSRGQLVAYLLLDGAAARPVIVGLFALLVAALLALLVGWRTRVAAAASWLLLLWFQLRNPTFLNGGDEVLRLTGFYLAVGYLAIPPGRRRLTVDRWLAGGDEPARIPAWPLRLIQVQIGILYAVTGFLKLMGETWWDGRAVYYALANANLTRFGVPEWAALEPVFVAAGLAVAWWELLFPALVSRDRSRRGALVFGVVVHGGIFVTMNIGVFSLAMLAAYPAFAHRRRTSALVDRWLGSLRRRIPGRGDGRDARAPE